MNYDKIIKDHIKNLNNQISKGYQNLSSTYLPQSKNPAIQIGTNILSGKKLSLPIEKPGLASTHTYILGSSGMGKSKFLERVARDLIQNRYGLLVLDGKNDLYNDLLDFCCLLRLANKTILIDPNDYEHSVGINYLECLGETSPEALAGMVLEGLKKFFKEDTEYKPWLEEWGPASLIPLINAKFTLLELFYFLRFKDPTFRNVLLQQQEEPFYKAKWDELVGVFREYDQANILNVLKTRASKFWQDRALKYIFGQEKTTIDWLKVMNEGGIVLAKLGNTNKVSPETCRLLGTAILHQLSSLASSRPQGKRRPFFIMADEFQRFITPDIADSLDRLRGFGIYFILSHQNRGQVEKEDPYLLDSIDSNCLNRIIFHISPKDARVEMENLFAGMIRTDRPQDVKEEVWQTKLRPIKTYEDIQADSYIESSGDISVSVSGESVTPRPEGGILGSDLIITTTSSQSEGAHKNKGIGQTLIRAPWYDYEEYQELTNRTYYLLEEIREKYIAWIERQDERKAQWRFLNKKPLPIITPYIEKAIVIEPIRQYFKKEIYTQSCRPTEIVNQEIEERVKKFLEANKAEEMPKAKQPPTTYRDKKKSPKT